MISPKRVATWGTLALLATSACQKNPGPRAEKNEAAQSAAAAPAPEAKEAFGRLSVAELEAKMAAAKSGKLKLAVFDNNGRDTYDQGHLPGAKWVLYDEIKASDLPTDKDTELVFYCYNEH